MMSPHSGREVRAGLVVLLGLGALVGLVSLAGGGPGFLSSRQAITVLFRDGQGVRVGCPVRIAGIDAGRVASIDLAEVDGGVRARVRLSVPASLASRLRQDARIAIEAGLTGQVVVNVVEAGRSSVALVPGQVVQGVETSLFDPLLEQVGMGPVERDGLRATIAEVRATAESVGPRLRELVAGLQETTDGLREALDAARPAVAKAAGRVEAIAEKVDAEQVAGSLARLDAITREVELLLTENRPVLTEALASVRDLSGEVRGMAATNAPKVEALLDGLNGTRVRVDGVLASAGIATAQAAEVLTGNRANLDRTLSNVREATDYGARLVQKLYGNPFYLSPFYKPTKEDIRAQEVYDAANTFLIGAKELRDAITSLQALRAKPPAQMTQREKEAYEKLYRRAWTLQTQLEGVSQGLAEGLRGATRR
jgi:phospholipid/cholesterol/gamma-HCH transport system substrate-binding protein